MGRRQVQPPTGPSSSPQEDEETRDPEEAAAAAAAAPAASLPTLRPRTLEEPPPPPAAAGGPLVRARTGPHLPRLPRSRCACSLSPLPSTRRPPTACRPPKPSSSPSPRARARVTDGAERRPAVGRREARPASLAPPPGPAADWVLRGNHLHSLPAPRPRARAWCELESCPGAELGAEMLDSQRAGQP